MVTKVPVFDVALTKAICDVLARTDYPGLTNSEIDTLLSMVHIPSPEGGANKRDRLFHALHEVQVRQECGNAVSAFVARALDPTRYVVDPGRRGILVDELGPILALHGYRVSDSGRLARGPKATNLAHAAEMAGSLRAELRRRGVHEEVLRYCSEELIAQSLFHATTEAAKSIPARIRTLTGSGLDGAELYDAVLGTKTTPPALRINDNRDESDASQHRGFKLLVLGIHGHYRNPRAHRTRLGATEEKQDLLDAFSLFSYIHRLLDRATIHE